LVHWRIRRRLFNGYRNNIELIFLLFRILRIIFNWIVRHRSSDRRNGRGVSFVFGRGGRRGRGRRVSFVFGCSWRRRGSRRRVRSISVCLVKRLRRWGTRRIVVRMIVRHDRWLVDLVD
jgi:hypothetical protein